jgi:hypothetical protein
MITRRGGGGGAGAAISTEGLTASIGSEAWELAGADTSGALAAALAAWFDTGGGACGLGCVGVIATAPGDGRASAPSAVPVRGGLPIPGAGAAAGGRTSMPAAGGLPTTGPAGGLAAIAGAGGGGATTIRGSCRGWGTILRGAGGGGAGGRCAWPPRLGRACPGKPWLAAAWPVAG